jgi:NAD(P)-dependent dehydrogenase (short-subunit alcohol dehydrogenase family)
MSRKQLGGKKILVTGAASGMGRACALFFRERGASIIVADIDFEGAKSTADEVEGEAFHVDLADPAAISGLAEGIAATCGPVSGLLNCAGIMPNAIMPPEAISSTEWDRFFAVNVRGTFFLSVVFGTQMAARGSGSIVNIASTTGLRSTPHHAYGVSKASVVQISRNLAAQWARSNVRVNSLSPGYVRDRWVDEEHRGRLSRCRQDNEQRRHGAHGRTQRDRGRRRLPAFR